MQRVKSQSSLSYIIKFTFAGYSSEKDAKDIEAFFKVRKLFLGTRSPHLTLTPVETQDKDVSKFNLSLTQALDSIRANAVWLDRSKDDILEWLTEFSKRYPSRL